MFDLLKRIILWSFIACWLPGISTVTPTRSHNNGIHNWQTGPWGVCWLSKDGCGPGVEERTVWCGDSLGRPVPKYLCRPDELPSHTRPCFTACQGIWKVGSWSECHLETGTRLKQDDGLCLGTRERNVTCFSMINDVAPKCTDALPPSKVSCYTLCPQDCVVGPWTSWTPCINECNERKYRTRQVFVPPAHGGSLCPFLSQSKLCVEKCPSNISTNEVTPQDQALSDSPNHHGLSSFSPSIVKKSSIKVEAKAPVNAKLRVGEWRNCKRPTDDVINSRQKRRNPRDASSSPRDSDTSSFESRLEWEIRDAISILESEVSHNEEKESMESLSSSQMDRLNHLRNSYPQVGVQERNITCIGSGGKLYPLSDCSPNSQTVEDLTTRSCIISQECQLKEWTPWKTVIEGCVAPNGQVVKEVKERRRSALNLQQGKGTPCPHLLERHTVPEPSLQPCSSKFQWLASTWGPCLSTVGPEPETQVTCGGGVQHRQITCTRVQDRIPVTETFCLHVEPPPRYQRCEVGCERDCVVGPWSAWGICTPAMCSIQPPPSMQGYRRRIREILVSASSGGKECPPIEEQTECHNAQCHQWLIGEWSQCTLASKSQSCGRGIITRNITCVDALGAPSPEEECSKELGLISVTEGCQVPCPYDCVIAPWSSWSPCSRPCADQKSVGYTHRNTTILAPSGSGGRECPAPDELTQVKTCREEPCTGAAWLPGEWGECILGTEDTCGEGVQIRPNFCIDQSQSQPVESHRCAGLSEPKQEKSCEILCGTKCSMTSWSDWSPCLIPKGCPSETKAVASKQTRWRRVLVHPSEESSPCGPTTEERPCAFDPGNCKISKWTVSDWSDCALSPEIECGTGYRVRGVHCVNGSGDITDPTECLLGSRIIPESSEKCYVLCDKRCVLSSWTSWSSCPQNKGCTNAKSIRTRALIDHTTKSNDCRMISLKETQDCLCSTYYSDPGSEWSQCLLGPPIDKIKSYYMDHKDILTGNREISTRSEDFDYREDNVMSQSNDEDTCGVGTRYRSLKCRRHDKILADPSSCGHNGIEWEPCMVECPSDCLVGHWEEWTSCNATCGAGLQYRYRKVVQESLWNGRNCPSIRQERACWGSCHTRWIAEGWNDCQLNEGSDCGNGFQNRTIKCVRLLSSGMEVVVVDHHCDLHQRPPNHRSCKIFCSGECVVSEWSSWSDCSRNCQSEAEHVRSRSVVRSPSENSSDCPHLMEREPCIKDVTCWTYSWQAGNWTHCIPLGRSSCGEGVRNRPISCVRSDGTKVKEYYCQRESRPAPQEKWCYVDCPIDCQVTSWTDWDDSKCSCGEKPGAMRRKRFILVNPSDSGRACPQNVEETLPCPVIPCYTWERSRWSECKLMGGKCGHGIMERNVRCIGPGGVDVSAEKCLALVHVGGHTWPYLAHALDLNVQDGCYVPCEGDCELTEWSPWSHCHRDCARGQQGGSQTRSRAIISTGSTTPCPGPLWENKPCVAGPCLSFSWQVMHGSVACVRSDGLVVTGGCGDVPRPCVPDCRVRNSMCSPVGVCVCQPGTRPHYSEAMRYRLTRCNPSFNMSLTDPQPLNQIKYLPEGINGWMFAMIGVGGAFVIFVIISVYLLGKSPREESAIPLTLRHHQSNAAQSS